MFGYRRGISLGLTMVFGLISMLVGLGIAVVGAQTASAAAARAERLQPMSVAALRTAAPGSEVLIEGKISTKNSAQHGFVAYVYEAYESHRSFRRRSSTWREQSRYTPALLVDISGGRVQLAESNYQLESPPELWNESGVRRYRGFKPTNIVTVIGTVAEGRQVKAELLYGGNRAAYIAAKRNSAKTLPLVGLGAGLVGVVMAGSGMLRLRRW